MNIQIYTTEIDNNTNIAEDHVLPSKNLWRGVILQAIDDADLFGRTAFEKAKQGPVYVLHLSDMDELLRSIQAETFRAICDIAEIDYSMVVNKINSVIQHYDFYRIPFFSPLFKTYHKRTANRMKKQQDKLNNMFKTSRAVTGIRKKITKE